MSGGALMLAAAMVFGGSPPALAENPEPRPALTVEAVQRLALEHAGLEAERVLGHLGRMRWADAMPELRIRVVHDGDRDGRTTVRLADARWMGDVAAVDTRGERLRLQGELVWHPGALLGGRAELAALQEVRKAAAARRELLEAVTRSWFALEKARMARAEALAAGDAAASHAAALLVAEQAALLDGLTGGRFARAVRR